MDNCYQNSVNSDKYIKAGREILLKEKDTKRNPMSYLVSSSCTRFPPREIFKPFKNGPFPEITHNLVYNTKKDCFDNATKNV